MHSSLPCTTARDPLLVQSLTGHSKGPSDGAIFDWHQLSPVLEHVLMHTPARLSDCKTSASEKDSLEHFSV